MKSYTRRRFLSILGCTGTAGLGIIVAGCGGTASTPAASVAPGSSVPPASSSAPSSPPAPSGPSASSSGASSIPPAASASSAAASASAAGPAPQSAVLRVAYSSIQPSFDPHSSGGSSGPFTFG